MSCLLTTRLRLLQDDISTSESNKTIQSTYFIIDKEEMQQRPADPYQGNNIDEPLLTAVRKSNNKY